MRPPLRKQTGSSVLVLLLTVLAGAACQPGGTAGGTQPAPAPTPTPKFNFAVMVRDGYNNDEVGQATVTLAVENETLEQKVTDDNGQANFSVDASYSGKRARLYAKSPYHHPADLEMSLTSERKIIQLLPKKFPKTDPDPEEPPPPRRAREAAHDPAPEPDSRAGGLQLRRQ